MRDTHYLGEYPYNALYKEGGNEVGHLYFRWGIRWGVYFTACTGAVGIID